jgi:hypothetical protein
VVHRLTAAPAMPIIGTIGPLRADVPRAVRGPRSDEALPFLGRAMPWGAMMALLLVAEHDGPTMIGVMRASNRRERVFDPSRKDKHWGRRTRRGIKNGVGRYRESR